MKVRNMAWTGARLGRLEDKSIDARLNIQARAAIISAVVMFATIITSSLLALDRQKQAHVYAQQALRAAMLEKDFTSLARDVFRHAAINTADSRKDVDGNIGDMKDSMTAAKAELDDPKMPWWTRWPGSSIATLPWSTRLLPMAKWTTPRSSRRKTWATRSTTRSRRSAIR
jgi:hypothetical protein